jgi:glycosyltransferase involved in cell wall biosynthesis
MITILSISQNYHITGGSDGVFFRTNSILTEKGHTVIPFTAASPKNLETPWSSYFPSAADFDHPNLKDIGMYIYSRNAAKAVEHLIKDHHIDIAHLHIYYGKLTASILEPLNKAGIPIIQTLHEYKLICPVYTLISNGRICEACKGKNYIQALPRRCNRGSLSRTALSVAESYVSRFAGSQTKINHFIAVSNFTRDKMIEMGIASSKISTVYNPTEIFPETVNSEPGKYLLYFGRIERIKGIFTLLEAITSLKTIQVKIVGDGNGRGEMEEYIKNKNLDHVTYLGFRSGSELVKLIKESLFVVLPSQWYEPFPLTILESFSHGKPVIGSNIGGITEQIVDGSDGFLVPPGDALSLKEKILWMVDHPEQTRLMGQVGREKASKLFNSEQYYQSIMTIYNRLIG